MIFKYIVLALYSPYIIYLKKSRKNLYEIYNLLKSKLFGKTAFSAMISIAAPYSGSINPIVEEFDENTAKCYIQEKRCLKNPFNSLVYLSSRFYS